MRNIKDTVESCVKKLGLTGTWYVVKLIPEDDGPHIDALMVPNDHGDSLIIITLNNCESHLVHILKYKDIIMEGAVRNGKYYAHVWKKEDEEIYD